VVNPNIGVRFWAVKTLLTNIHVLIAKWNVVTAIRSMLKVFWLVISSQCHWSSENAAPRFRFPNKGSFHSLRIYLILLHTLSKCVITHFRFNIWWITKFMPHLHLAHCSICFAPVEDPPTPISRFMVVRFGYVPPLHIPCSLHRYSPSDVIVAYKNLSNNKPVRYDCSACF